MSNDTVEFFQRTKGATKNTSNRATFWRNWSVMGIYFVLFPDRKIRPGRCGPVTAIGYFGVLPVRVATQKCADRDRNASCSERKKLQKTQQWARIARHAIGVPVPNTLPFLPAFQTFFSALVDSNHPDPPCISLFSCVCAIPATDRETWARVTSGKPASCRVTQSGRSILRLFVSQTKPLVVYI